MKRSGEINAKEDVEEMWKEMKDSIFGSASKVCGTVKLGQKRKGCEWWSDRVKMKIEEKKKAWERLLRENNEERRANLRGDFKKISKEARRTVKESKREANDKLGKKMNEDANGNMKLFWKEVRKAKDSGRTECVRMKSKDGESVSGELGIRERWKEYFEDLLNVAESDEVNVNICGFDGAKRSKYLGVEDITREEVVNALDKLKNGKAAGIDNISTEMLKFGGIVLRTGCGKYGRKSLVVVKFRVIGRMQL